MISYSTIPMKAIADGAKIYSGFAFKSTDFKKSGVPIIKIGNLIKDGSVSYNNCDYFSPNEITPSHSDFILNDRDILIAMTGQGSVGRVCQIRINKNEIVLLNQRVGKISVDTNIFDRDYLFFVLSSHKYAEILFSAGYGSGQPNLSPDVISSIKIPYLDLSQQHKIGILLISLEDKIRNNYQIITELESLAKNTYDYWFLQFEFPDENGKPYKSSGGDMVWNEELKCEIPYGWNVNSLSAYTLSNYSRIPNNIGCIQYLDTANIHKNHIENVVLYRNGIDVIPSRAQRYINKNDILISTVRPNQHHYGIIKRPLKNMVASTGFTQITCNLNSKYNDILYLFITSEMNIRTLEKIAASSTSSYPSIRDEDILSLKIALPDDIIQLDEMASKLSIIHTKISLLEKENRELVSLRDFLLPLLMNGQAEITE